MATNFYRLSDRGGDRYLNGVMWYAQSSKQHDLGVFSAGFVPGALGMYIAAWLYGYRHVQ